jgi:hypothetical protein
MKMKVFQLFDYERFLMQYVSNVQNNIVPNVDDGALAWGYGRNAVKMQRVMPEIRKEFLMLKPSPELADTVKAYEEERNSWLKDNGDKPEDEKVSYIEELMTKHGVKEELERIAKLTTDFMNEEREVNLYRINKNTVKGMRPGKDDEKCSLTMQDTAYLISLGLLYDPEDDDFLVEEKEEK